MSCLAGVTANAGGLQGSDLVSAATCLGIPPKNQNNNTEMAIGTYDVTISSAVISSSSTDVTANYLITFIDGTLVVTSSTYTLTYADAFNPNALPSAQVGVGNVTLASAGAMSRSGYVFAGWVIDSVTYSAGASYNLGANKTATAAWTLQTFTLTYSGNGNTGGTAPTPTIGVGNVTIAALGSLVRSGYDFVAWEIGGVS